jgi:hypothetical protein
MGDLMIVGSIYPDFPGVAVAPTHPAVRSELISLVRSVAERPGVAGVVLRDTDPPGYDVAPGALLQDTGLQLGYALSGRLAFLRQYHADPVDLYPAGGYSGIANTNLPNFDDNNYWSGQVTSGLWTKWAAFRRDADLQLLRDIFKAAGGAADAAPHASSLTVIVKQRRRGQQFTDSSGKISFSPGWYGSWDSITKDPPTLRGYEENAMGDLQVQPLPENQQATLESAHVYTPVSREMLDRYASIFARMSKLPAGAQVQIMSSFKTGCVLDLSDDPYGDNGNGQDPLTNLVNEINGKFTVASPIPTPTAANE